MKYEIAAGAIDARREAEDRVEPAERRIALTGVFGVRRIAIALFAIAGILAVADVVSQTIQFTIAPGFVGWDETHKLFDLDREQSLPTWYSIVLLFLISVSLMVIAWRAFVDRARYRWHWLGLALIFLALSVDEQVMGHETATGPVRETLGLSEGGLLHWAWIIPALVCVAILGIVYFRFLLDLRPGTRELVILAAALYVGGAVGMEMFGGWVIEQRGEETLAYETVTSLEEILELTGSTLFLTVLLREIARRIDRVTFQISS